MCLISIINALFPSKNNNSNNNSNNNNNNFNPDDKHIIIGPQHTRISATQELHSLINSMADFNPNGIADGGTSHQGIDPSINSNTLLAASAVSIM